MRQSLPLQPYYNKRLISIANQQVFPVRARVEPYPSASVPCAPMLTENHCDEQDKTSKKATSQPVKKVSEPLIGSAHHSGKTR